MTSAISNDQLAIATNNQIIIDGQVTDWRITQKKDLTVVFRLSVPWKMNSEHINLPLPRQQYSTSHDNPACGAGRIEFYRDLKAALANEKASA